MYSTKHKEICDQYINQYLPTIEVTLEFLRKNKVELRIPYAQFLFSLVDYFGLLFTIASTGVYNKYSKSNFINFIKSEYFPKDDRCKASFLWFIRNGIIHQIFPKACGIATSLENTLLFRDTQNRTIPILNLNYLDKVLYSAIVKFNEDLIFRDDYVNNLHREIIEEHYGFDDFTEFKNEIDQSYEGDYEKIFGGCL